MVQAQSLRSYRELVTDLGGYPTRPLRKAGIEPPDINRLTAFISFESLIDLLEHSADDLGCAYFGLRLAERQDIGILGTFGAPLPPPGDLEVWVAWPAAQIPETRKLWDSSLIRETATALQPPWS